ncbi:MAG: phosphodiester glycosidase family protein [Leptolyngbya sp. SIOISBB]|nr:phosphodiester glycosidase family protein [Leptolyngbya sp. SIOISBB]
MRVKQTAWGLGGLVLLAPLLLYTRQQWQRSPRVPSTQELFAGVTYQRRVADEPWPQVIHIVTLDLTTPGIAIVASAGSPDNDEMETTAQTTAQFLEQTATQVAVNANFFYPFEEKTPWNFRPHVGDRTNILGAGVADGESYSPSEAHWPALCFDGDNRAQIAAGGICPEGTQQAIAGNQQLVADGEPVPFDFRDRAYARVMAVVSRGGEELSLVVVDGKQPHYSEGATLAQLTDIALSLNADAALNLDGGGSTTLVIDTPNGPQPLNAPIHTKWPMRLRPVANHLGIRARSHE